MGEHLAVDLPGATALFTTRRGGHSDGPYASLNLGLNTDDDPAAVQRNHAAVQAAVGRPLAAVRQVHGTTIHPVGRDDGERPEADGQLATEPGRAPIVLVADCLPIVLAAPGAVAVLHAGWRGLAGGIVPSGLRALRDAVGPGVPVCAAIGPGAGRCCYEVGDEVRTAFAPYAAVAQDGRRLDLKAIARAQLEADGVSAVHDLG